VRDRSRNDRSVVAAIAASAAELARRSPAPRDLPYFGLDHPPGVLGRLLADLSDLGIFRFYSEVLDVSPGRGGPARWLVRRHDCRATTIHREIDAASAVRFLTREAHLADRVQAVVGAAEQLPFVADTFTHVWGVGALGETRDAGAALHEILRVVRPGGWVALAERDVQARSLEGLDAIGFRDVEVRDVTALLEEDSAFAHLVAERIATRLGQPPEPRAPPPRVMRVKARKPS
jgi:SAM-dependent methyltransferase